ncbi:MAG TPA: VOC family protein [Actinomycetota bacterium]|nr:VOC family protein [Actinomycetota bacterium]
MQKIVTNLWFDTEAEEAAKFYCSIFKDSKINAISHYGDAGPRPPGTVLTVEFELAGQQFTALNGGPEFKFTEAISLLVNCESQKEVDELWTKLTEGGGEESVCGWVKDRFGLSWQIIPTRLGELISDEDSVRANAVMQSMLQMRKIEIAELEKAYEQAHA